MTGMGFVYNYSGLMAARWFLGLAEAGLFPGINYYLSCWYKRSELGIRAVSETHTWYTAKSLLISCRPSSFQQPLSRVHLAVSSPRR